MAGRAGGGAAVGRVAGAVKAARAAQARLPESTLPLDRFAAMIPIVAAHDPFRNDLSPRTVRRAAAALVTTLVEALPPAASARAGGIAAELALPALTPADRAARRGARSRARARRRPWARRLDARRSRGCEHAGARLLVGAGGDRRATRAAPRVRDAVGRGAAHRGCDRAIGRRRRRGAPTAGRVALVLRLRSGWRSARRAAARGDVAPGSRRSHAHDLEAAELRRAARDAAGGRRVRLCSVCARLRPDPRRRPGDLRGRSDCRLGRTRDRGARVAFAASHARTYVGPDPAEPDART